MSHQIHAETGKDKILKVLREANENPLEFLDKVLEKTIKHDKMHRRLSLLTNLSAYGPNPLNVILKAETTTGKSWIMIQTAKLFPEEDVMKYCDASPKAFYWKYGKQKCKEHGDPCPEKCKAEKIKIISFKHKILMFLDQPNDQLLQVMKPLLSHDDRTLIRIVTDPTRKGTNKTIEVHLQDWPSLCFASCQQQTDPETASRAFIISPDDSQEKVDQVLHFITLKEKDHQKWKQEYENDQEVIIAKQMIREIKTLATSYKEIQIEKPYIEELEEKFKKEFPTCPRSMRAFPQLLALIDAVALLNHKNRTKTECEDGSLKITSTLEDEKAALEILNYFLEGLKYGLSTAVVDFYKRIARPLLKEQEVARKKDFAKRYRDVKGRYSGPRQIQRYYLNPLLDVGLLNEEKDRDDNRFMVYTLNETPKIMDQGGSVSPPTNKGDVPTPPDTLSDNETIEKYTEREEL
ncbi:hypothetical protein ACFLQ6_09065 [Thermoproteota archaeon]